MKNTQNLMINVKKSHLFAKIVQICACFAFILCLTGCARKDPVENVIDYHQQHIADVLDYAYNNIEQNKDVIFLENELKGCDLAYADIKQAYYGQISTCRAEKEKWKIVSASLFLLLCALVYLRIRKVI